MQEKIIYWVQDYTPEFEAISKEVESLHKYFPSLIINIRGKFRIKDKIFSFNYKKMPFIIPLIPLIARLGKISHIYTSLGNYFFLKLLQKRPIVLTSAGPATKEKIRLCSKFYNKVDRFIVQTEEEKELLNEVGVKKERISLIYPGISLKKFNYNKPKNKQFTLLLASSPLIKGHIEQKGIRILIESLPKEINLIILLRKKYYEDILPMIHGKKNIKIINRYVGDMNKIYGLAHATVYFPLDSKTAKACPFSVLESLAAGKPVIVTSVTGISDLIKRENCGVISEPTRESFLKSVHDLKKNYQNMQKKCRKVTEKYFSIEQFIKSHEEVYNTLR